jgi:hypothetical protein
MENPTTPTDDEAELALMVAYLRDIQKREFYGIVELTFQKGELKVARETRSRPVAALASDIWPQIPAKARTPLKQKLKEHKGFVVD